MNACLDSDKLKAYFNLSLLGMFFFEPFITKIMASYLSSQIMSFIEAQEASEYDQVASKIILLITKITLILSCIYLASPIWAFVPLAGLYLWHVKVLTQATAAANNASYSRNLKKFWTFFRCVFVLAMIINCFLAANTTLLPLMLASVVWPFAIHGLKSFISPSHKYARYFYYANDFLFQTVVAFNTSLGLAKKFSFGFEIVGTLVFIFSLAKLPYANGVKEKFVTELFNLADKLMDLSLIPITWKRLYDRTFRVVGQEYRAVSDYMSACRLQPRYSNIQLAAVIAEAVEPSYQVTAESLYLGDKRGVGENPTVVAPERIKQRLDEICTHLFTGPAETFQIFLEQLAQESPSYREGLLTLERNDEADALPQIIAGFYRQHTAHRNIITYIEAQNISPELELMVRRILENIDHIIAVGANPGLQPGVDITPQDSAKIPGGLFNILGKILESQQQIETASASNRITLITAQSRLLARLMDKIYRCQGAIIGLISDETLTQGDPLDAAWSALLNREIQAAYRRQMRAFCLDKCGLDIDIPQERERLSQLHSLFMDPNNIEHQYLISIMHFPGRGHNDRYEDFANITLSRHFNHMECTTLQQSSSVFQSTFFPQIFAQQTVQELIATTQYLYLTAKLEQSSAPWVSSWESQWQSYLNESYPIEATQQLPLPAENQYALFRRYQETSNQAQMSQEQRRAFERCEEIIKPQGYFDSWCERQKREYFHQNKTLVVANELAGEQLLERIENDEENAIHEAAQAFVSREFATLILFNKGFLEVSDREVCGRNGIVYRPPCQQHISQIGVIPQLMGFTRERAVLLGL